MEKLTIEVEKLPNSQSSSQAAERILKFFYGNKEEALQFVGRYYGPTGKYFDHSTFGSQIAEYIQKAKIVKSKKINNGK